MAKRSRRVVRGESPSTRPESLTAPRPATSAPETRATRRARTRRVQPKGPLERYRTLIISGAAVVGLLIIGFVIFQGGSRPVYACTTLLTPGPVESLTPRPSFPVTPSPLATPSPVPTESPSASGTPGPSGTPSASGTPSGTAAPAPTAPASASVVPSESAVPSPSDSGSPGASAGASPTAQPSPTPEPTNRLGFTTTIFTSNHVPNNTSVTYAFCPPTSGQHYQAPAAPIPARVYPPTEEKAPQYWLHNLEHGYVVLAYRCPSGTLGTGDCPTEAEMAQMQAWFDQAPASSNATCPKKVLVVRFDKMDTRFALLAWGRALLTNDFNLDTGLTFAQQWMDHEAVPERGGC